MGDIEPPEKYAIHPVKSRLQGFNETLDEAGISLPRKYIMQAAYTQEGAQQAAHELLSLDQPPTAIFAAADIQAVSIMKAARRLKRRVPEDLAVMGFDDIDLAEYMDLTTVRQNLDESGRLAAEFLLASIGESSRKIQRINLPLTLIERLTT